MRYDLDTFIHPTVSPRIRTYLSSSARAHVSRRCFSGVSSTDLGRNLSAVQCRCESASSDSSSSAHFSASGCPISDPEKIVSYEAEYQGWYCNHRLRGRAALFFNHITDLIASRPFAEFKLTQTIQVKPTSMEVKPEWIFLPRSWLSGFANFSYQEIGQSFTGTARRGAPRFKWNIGARADWDNGINGEVAYHYVGAATYPYQSGVFRLRRHSG